MKLDGLIDNIKAINKDGITADEVTLVPMKLDDILMNENSLIESGAPIKAMFFHVDESKQN